MWSLKYDTNEPIYETETKSGTYEQIGGCQGGGGWERVGVGVWDQQCKLVYIEWINNKVLLYSTGKYIQYPVINHNGKEYEKECVCMYIYIYIYIYIYKTESLCCTAINTTL